MIDYGMCIQVGAGIGDGMDMFQQGIHFFTQIFYRLTHVRKGVRFTARRTRQTISFVLNLTLIDNLYQQIKFDFHRVHVFL